MCAVWVSTGSGALMVRKLNAADPRQPCFKGFGQRLTCAFRTVSIICVTQGTCRNPFQVSANRDELHEHIRKCEPPPLLEHCVFVFCCFVPVGGALYMVEMGHFPSEIVSKVHAVKCRSTSF